MNRFAAAAVLAAASVAGPTVAQNSGAPKDIVPAGVPAFTALGQWIQSLVAPEPAPPLVQRVESVTWSSIPAQGAAYQPLPVVLGQPELPLLRPVAIQPGSIWSPQFNYQGMHVRFVVLDAQGKKHRLRAMSDPPLPGERFKIRVTPTFDAVAEVDLVLGSGWDRQRVGQIWPAQGSSLEIRAGETADLPLAPSEYFVMPAVARQQSLVLSVRHPQAVGPARSDQPAYRQDSSRGSDYLQLVTPNKAPTFEQLIQPVR
jgi:hypothetical protein